MKAAGAVACVIAMLAAAGCGAAAHRPVGAASPSPPENSPAAAAPLPTGRIAETPSPAAPVAMDLVFTGSLPARVSSARPLGSCGRAPGGFDVELQFTSAGQGYVLSIGLIDYRGPATYTVPPERVSVHSAGHGTGFYPGTSGSVTVRPGERTGTIDVMLGQGREQVQGSWACA